MAKSTILVEMSTRKLLKKLGTKGQTYDQVINELIKTKRSRASFDAGLEDLQTSKSKPIEVDIPK